MEAITITLPITITLVDPIEFGNETITELVIARKPKVKDLKGIELSKLTTDAIIKVAGRLCNKPSSVIEELSFEDAAKIGEVIMPFLENILAMQEN